MKVSIIGTGYVGLVSGTCFAELGHHVTCIDVNDQKIKMLKEGKSPIYEPGLDQLLKRNISQERLFFTTDYQSVKDADVVFLAVGTPSQDNGEANLSYLYSAAESSAPYLRDGAILVIKSTVPVGTSKIIRQKVSDLCPREFFVVNNPEFLKEGSAINDFMKPDRVVIGHDNEKAAKVMEQLYAPLVRQGNPVYTMSNVSAETTKYAANCMLATKISFINEIARFCDAIGADVEEVRRGIASDKRIGNHFLYPGPGYGGSCFPKDVKALVATAKNHGLNMKVIQAVEDVNQEQKTILFNKISDHYKTEKLTNKKIAFWGAAFKANTDDIRESAAIDMAIKILKAQAKVQFYDPVASENFSAQLAEWGYQVESYADMYQVLQGADALVVLTEWPEFRNPHFGKIATALRDKVIFDGRNLFHAKDVLAAGLSYYAIGKRIE